MPIEASRGGCCIPSTDDVGHPKSCGGRVVYAGRWRAPDTGSSWRVFLCAHHVDRVVGLVTDVRLLTDADTTALQMRRDRWDAALRGERWIRPRPLPR